MTLGLVLGAGGVGGLVFHAGVLDGLRVAGIDPETAATIVGTSSGAVTGAFLRLGRDHDEVVADWLTPATDDERRRALRTLVTGLSARPVDVDILARVRSGAPPLAVLAPLLPPGPFPTDDLVPWFDGVQGIPDGLWIPAMAAGTAEGVVFGRDRSATLLDALKATMAVPGTFRPHTIDGTRYLDGGALSSTHADLLIGSSATTVVVSAPMARPDSGWVLRHADRRFTSESDRLARSGVSVVEVAPAADHQDLFDGFPRRGLDRAVAIRAHGRSQLLAAIG